MKEKVLQKFGELHGNTEGVSVYFAPGRVNMIGEHTDYNGGHVFPCALTIGTYMAVRKREDRKLTFYSMNFEDLGVLESSIDDIKPEKSAGWTQGSDPGISGKGHESRLRSGYRTLRQYSQRFRPFLFRLAGGGDRVYAQGSVRL